MDEKEYLSTGEMAKILKTTKNTLFHYDELGLFCPALVRENGYRAYSYRQMDIFFTITSLRKSGMSLREIKAYMQSRNPEKLRQILEVQQQHIQEEIQRLRQMGRFLRNHLQNLEEVKHLDFSRIVVEALPEELLHCSPHMGDFEEKKALNLLGHFFAETIYLRGFGAVLSLDSVRAGEYLYYDFLFRFVDKKEKGQEYRVKPAGNYLVAYHRGSYYETGQTYQKMLDFAEEQNLSLGQDVYEEYLIDDLSVSEERDFVTRLSMSVL